MILAILQSKLNTFAGKSVLRKYYSEDNQF